MNDENVAPSTGLSEFTAIRRLNKPLMERRRRQRINNCLDELKTILETLSKNESSYLSKLEKADILELTVQCIRNLKKRQLDSAAPIGRSDAESYALGYDACMSEVMRCLRSRQCDKNSESTVQPAVVTGLLNHLARRRGDILVNSDDRPGVDESTATSCDVSGPPTHRQHTLPVVNRVVQRHEIPISLISIHRDVHPRYVSSTAIGIHRTSEHRPAYETTPSSDVDMTSSSSLMTSSTSSTSLADDCAVEQPTSFQTSRFTPSPSRHLRHSPTMSTLQGDLRGRSRYGDLSTPGVAVLHDSDRLRRRVIRPTGTSMIPTVPVAAAEDQSILRATLSIGGRLPLHGVDAGLSFTCNGGYLGPDELMAVSSFTSGSASSSFGGSGNGSSTETVDCIPTSSSMWRPW